MARPGKYIGNGPVTNFKIIADAASNVFFSDGSLNPNSRPFTLLDPPIYRLNASRTILPGSPLPFDIITIENISPALAEPGAFVRFSIEPATFSKQPSNITSNVSPKLALRTRGASIYQLDNRSRTVLLNVFPWLFLGGLQLSSKGAQNDLILPYGIGSRDYIDDAVTERGTTYINIGDGADAIIGGYGQDYFGSREREQLIDLKQPKISIKSSAKGTKFFVGGSGDDVLDGSSSEDFLIGDRFNGFELYLPAKALSNISFPWQNQNIPFPWQNQVESIKKYQDPGYSDTTGAGNELLANSSGSGPGSTQYPLWIPGNDVIRGYEGDDIIYGDDNTMDLNLKQLSIIRSKLSETPAAVVNLGGGINGKLWNRDGFKLAADFIHGGSGRDQIFGGVGADAIIGGGDSDVINLGPQVIVDGYNPFFGPKVAYGDDAFYDEVTGKWQKDQASVSPDLFIVGRLFSDLTDLEKSNSGDIPALSIESKTVAQKLAGFESAWKLAGKAVKAIPKVGSIVSGIVDASIKMLKLQDPKPTPPGKPAKALDAMTIIKDFDPTDMITFNLLRGQVAKYEKGSLSIAASDKDNPLIGDLAISNGARIVLADKAGTSYTRVFLQDVQKLYFLAQTPSEDGSSVAITLGGSAFGEALNDAGAPLYQPVIF